VRELAGRGKSFEEQIVGEVVLDEWGAWAGVLEPGITVTTR
jgi:hypothetical protein